jgi:hypothetical protein
MTISRNFLLIVTTSDVIQQDLETGTAQSRLIEDFGQSELATTKKAEIALTELVFQK